MPKLAWDKAPSRGARSIVLALPLILGTAGCETAPTAAAGLGAPIVRTTRGDPVRANSPPGVEVTLGCKQVLPTGEMRTD